MNVNYFEDIVTALGSRQEYFPGTGGNISLKLEDGTMLIKASGKRVLHMNEEDGIVPLYYNEIKEFFHLVELFEEGEKESDAVIQRSLCGSVKGRPSIETGFHTLLSSAVIHSHSVYVNMLTCASSFEMLVDTLFLGSDIPYMNLAYAKPGYYLTHLFLDKVKKLSGRPKVIFMKNHGIVVTASTLEDAILLHEEVNERIRKYFGLQGEEYLKGELFHYNDTCSVSKTALLNDFVFSNISIFEMINNYILFPDLTVFCQDIVIADRGATEAKIVIDTKTREIIYNTTKKEAHCIEENLVAFAYLMTKMKENHLRPVYISEEEADSIRNMEQEKYRKRLLQR